jgi:transposase
VPFYSPLSHGVPRVDDRRIISGIIFVIRNGLRWRDAPAAYGPHKTIYNRFIRWSRLGVFNKIFAGLYAKGGKPDQLMIDVTTSRRIGRWPACSKRAVPRRIGRTKGGLNSKALLSAVEGLHAVCDGNDWPLVMLLSEGQMSDYKGAALMIDALPGPQSSARRQGRTGRSQHHRQRHHPARPTVERLTANTVAELAEATGAASTPATIAARTPSCPLPTSPLPSFSGSVIKA